MTRKRSILLGVVIGLVAIAGLVAIFRQQLIAQFFSPTQSSIREVQTEAKLIETVATNLTTPWSIVFLQGGDLLVTERSGQVKRIGGDGAVYPISGVRETSEGGLLGIALHPKFADNSLVYLYFTTMSEGKLTNQVDQYRYDNQSFSFVRTLLAGIPAATNHDGGAIQFGPDGKLYVTTGDAAEEALAQDKGSLAGKILRINDDGSLPSDNPFGTAVWSYGHRNPQGIAWDEQGRLWSVEHGPSGAATGRDELNLITRGANYGWPTITGDQQQTGMQTPIAQSGDAETWAPAGIAYYDGALYFAGLRGRALYKAQIQGETVALSKYFTDTYGRLRAVSTNDDKLYIGTSNRDGRGSPIAEDDRIFRVTPAKLGN